MICNSNFVNPDSIVTDVLVVKKRQKISDHCVGYIMSSGLYESHCTILILLGDTFHCAEACSYHHFVAIIPKWRTAKMAWSFIYDFIRLRQVLFMWLVWQMYDYIHDLLVLCHVVKLCNIRDLGRWNFHYNDSKGQVGVWPNGSNGTKWVIETDINDSNWRLVKVTGIRLEFSTGQVKLLSLLWLTGQHLDTFKFWFEILSDVETRNVFGNYKKNSVMYIIVSIFFSDKYNE